MHATLLDLLGDLTVCDIVPFSGYLPAGMRKRRFAGISFEPRKLLACTLPRLSLAGVAAGTGENAARTHPPDACYVGRHLLRKTHILKKATPPT
jgi:hypothetical protein